MFVKEAEWIGEEIRSLVNSGASRILNIGSATSHFREVVKPHIYNNIFKPLEKTGVHIVHSDIKDGVGVDLVGDLYDSKFLEKLKEGRYDVVLCSNLLEHLENRKDICEALVEVLHPGGYLIITVPYRYPYHLDPIDTMYRPNIKELADSFSGTNLIKSKIIDDSQTYAEKLINDKRLAAIIFARSFLPFYKPRVWWNTVSYLPNLFRTFQTTCIVLQKEES